MKDASSIAHRARTRTGRLGKTKIIQVLATPAGHYPI